LRVAEYIVLDVLIGHAVRLAWLDPNLPKPLLETFRRQDLNPANYSQHKVQAWKNFYASSPVIVAEYVVKSLQFLSQLATADLSGSLTLP
jgi:phosphorylase kinase alpha/beta subunit